MSKTRKPTNTPRSKPRPNPGSGREPLRGNSAFEKAFQEMRHQPPGAYPNISGKWLMKAALTTLAGIALLTWLTYCWLFWQGSWQLIYHPTETVKRTPASVGLAFEPARFGVDASGTPQRTGWWVPAWGSQWTALYLHGADGNLGDTVDALAALHRAGIAVFAIDYRGYGQSAKARPSETAWLEDAEAAVGYLTQTRHLSPAEIVVYGQGLGANLAAELAARHGSLAGVVLAQPLPDGAEPIFTDVRSHMVPAHWLTKDRWDLTAAARSLRQPSLWLLQEPAPGKPAMPPDAYNLVEMRKTLVWLDPPIVSDQHFSEELERWLGDLTGHP